MGLFEETSAVRTLEKRVIAFLCINIGAVVSCIKGNLLGSARSSPKWAATNTPDFRRWPNSNSAWPNLTNDIRNFHMKSTQYGSETVYRVRPHPREKLDFRSGLKVTSP